MTGPGLDRRSALVTFDLDDTLWEMAPVLRRAARMQQLWLTEHCPPVAERFRIEDWQSLRNELVEAHPTLGIHLSELRQRMILEALKRCGYGDRQARRLAADAFAVFLEARCEVDLFDGVRDTLEALAVDYRLGAITNGNADLARVGLADVFDFSLSAETVGVAKPDARIFREALARAGLPAYRAVHVGDDPEKDVAAALRVGMRALWANVLGRDTEARPPVPEVRSLRELPALLPRVLRGEG